MANKNLLHKSKLKQFKSWLLNNDWELFETKADFQVLLARKQGRNRPLIVYNNINSDHFSIDGRDTPVIHQFISSKGETNV